ncbi:hypothetical protein SF123566_4876 [Shigella flexneri 1235-66]|nr:hypothetical protein SF123566_4876 [Shigella flexneri 1235-66]
MEGGACVVMRCHVPVSKADFSNKTQTEDKVNGGDSNN